MRVLVDTSAFLALGAADDVNHARARQEWERLRRRSAHLLTTNYVIVEAVALIQRRLGMDAVRSFVRDVLPGLAVLWVSPEWHGAALSAVIGADRRQLSLVDCTTFEAMRALGIEAAFTFDRHFAEMGFDALPDDA